MGSINRCTDGVRTVPLLLRAALVLCALVAQQASLAATHKLSPEDAERTRVREELLWQRDPQQEILLRAAIQHSQRQQQQSPPPYNAQQLEQLFGGHRFLLPMRDMRRGITHRGTMGRLRALMHRLLTGNASTCFKAGALGGSPSAGHGASVPGLTDYFSVFSGWVKTSFPNITMGFCNGAIPATPSKYMALCLHSHMDPDVDLVFIEYNTNDMSSSNNQVEGNPVVMSMERLIRSVMELPGKPAVVLLQVTTFAQAQSRDDMFVGNWRRPYYSTNEDIEGALCQYYNIPCISLRGALHHVAEVERRRGLKWRDLYMDQHPGDAGYKALADLAVYLMQEATLDLLAEPLGPGDEQELAEPMPEPMYAGNVPPASTQCSVGVALQRRVAAALDFDLVNEGTASSPKWGYVGTQPGAFVELHLPTGAAEDAPSGGPVAVHLLYLKSYVSMGQAAVTCVRGCECKPQLVDALHADRTSTVFIHSFEVTRSASCMLRIEVTRSTNSGGHKFKVTGIVAGAAADVGLAGATTTFKGQFFLYASAKYTRINATFSTAKK